MIDTAKRTRDALRKLREEVAALKARVKELEKKTCRCEKDENTH